MDSTAEDICKETPESHIDELDAGNLFKVRSVARLTGKGRSTFEGIDFVDESAIMKDPLQDPSRGHKRRAAWRGRQIESASPSNWCRVEQSDWWAIRLRSPNAKGSSRASAASREGGSDRRIMDITLVESGNVKPQAYQIIRKTPSPSTRRSIIS